MKSSLPKPLHSVCGFPIISYILKAAQSLNPAAIGIVVGHESQQVIQAVKDGLASWQVSAPVVFIPQTELTGSGSAVKVALPLLKKFETIFILNGDIPLLRAQTLQQMAQAFEAEPSKAMVLGVTVPNPKGYGRIVRDADGKFHAIVEEADADLETKKICEINSGMYVFDSKSLQEALSKLTPQGPKKEYYLTDTLSFIKQTNQPISLFFTADYTEVLGINDKEQLAQAEQIMRGRTAKRLMEEGVTLINPQDVYIDAQVKIGADTVIYPGTYILGNSVIGHHCVLEGGVYVRDSFIGNDVTLKMGTYVEESSVEENCQLGPYAHLRPLSVLKKGAKVGNFSEIKKSVIGEGSKVNHLSYIGDTQMGAGVNVGAGTITCNYDGKKKHQTVIEDHVFIGSNVNFVAPVTVREYAKIGAGSTITKEVAAQSLGIARARQVVLEKKGVKKND
ncbi:MAG: bifunctional UDP-N-acetylglucosamine diphosphorylase/glucosamine-1-phosphate N-acetyltransferase GlmU [Elusimicrobiaceae bacterium]|nr:bifunctional UDP-N-acetylglucosamine diphosphorylase/glucosamine-1-phosphate N-acetyltransferase GlmU [Elusimicrobiaceae bacterium]